MGYQTSIQVPELNVSTQPIAERGGWRLVALVALVVTIGCALRFWGIGTRALWLDESYSAWFSELDWISLWFDSPRYETHPPFYYSLLKLWRMLAGDDASALRSLSAVAGLAAIPLLAYAALTLGKLAPVRRPLFLVGVAAGFMAVSPRLILIAQDARPYALLLASYALALTCWLRLTISFRAAEKYEGKLIDWIGLAVGTSLTLWLHFLGILYAAALFGALLLSAALGASQRRWVRLGVTCGAVLLSYLPCFLMLVGRTGDWGSGWLAWEPARAPGALLDLYGLFEQTEVWTPIAARILFAGLIAAGLRFLWSAGHRGLAGGLGLLIFFPPLAAMVVSQLGHPIFVPRTLVGVLAPAYLVAAYALAALRAQIALIIGGLAALVIGTNLSEALVRPSLEPWDEVAASLERNLKPGDSILAYPNDAAFPLRRALQREIPIKAVPAPFPALTAAGTRPAGSPAVVAIDETGARSFAANTPRSNATIWVVIRNGGLFDPEGKVAKGLATGRRPGPVRHWRNIDLQPLYPE